MAQSKLQKIIEAYQDEEILVATGFDDAVIGIETDTFRLVYSIPKCISILMGKYSMEYDEAIDFFHYNVSGSFVGEKTPIWVEDIFN